MMTSHLLVHRESKIEGSKVRILGVLDPQKALVELCVQRFQITQWRRPATRPQQQY